MSSQITKNQIDAEKKLLNDRIKNTKEKIENKQYNVRFKTAKERKRFKSDIWNTFQNIFDEKNEIILDLIYCEQCNIVFPYDSKRTGTTTLALHTCANKSELTMKSFVVIQQKPITEVDKENVSNAALKFVVKDLHAFNKIEGEGLADLLVIFTELGQKFGRFTREDVRKILPSPTTVSIFFI